MTHPVSSRVKHFVWFGAYTVCLSLNSCDMDRPVQIILISLSEDNCSCRWDIFLYNDWYVIPNTTGLTRWFPEGYRMWDMRCSLARRTWSHIHVFSYVRVLLLFCSFPSFVLSVVLSLWNLFCSFLFYYSLNNCWSLFQIL